MKALIISLLALSLLSACAVAPIKQSKVEGEFDGISSSFASNSSNKLSDIRIMIVHGVGPQIPGYANEFIERFRIASNREWEEELHQRIDIASGLDSIDPNWMTKSLGTIDITRLKSGGTTVTFFAVHWADITNDQKSWLSNNHSATKGKRTILNDKLKRTVMNENLSDFVLYASPQFNEEIKLPILRSMEYMYGINPVMFDGDTLLNLKSKNRSQNVSYYFITGSLGTKIVFDVYYDIGNEARLHSSTSTGYRNLETTANALPPLKTSYYMAEARKASRSITDFRNGNIEAVFSMSNQLPLLSLLHQGVPCANCENPMEDYLHDNYNGLCRYIDGFGDPFELIGFYDPNDLLGYKLIVDPNYDCRDKLQISNCVVTNAIPFLGLIASPRQAHVGGWKNKKTIRLIVDGYHN